MLAPFFMKAHGYSIALAGIPLAANGIGRVSSDLLSGIMATYFSAGALLIAATAIGLATSAVGYLFLDTMPVFVGVWILFGLTEAMFALALRKIGFDQSAPERQGRVQGQMASALGIGFTLGPLLGGFVGKWLGPDGLFFLYSVPQFFGLLFILVAGAQRYRKTVRHSSADPMARRNYSFKQSALSRLLPRYLPVISVLDRSDADRVSFFSHESRRVKSGSGRDHGFSFALDRYARALQRRLALRSDKLKPGDFTRSRPGDPDVFSSGLWFGFYYAIDSTCGDDHGLWFYQRGSDHVCAAVSEPDQ